MPTYRVREDNNAILWYYLLSYRGKNIIDFPAQGNLYTPPLPSEMVESLGCRYRIGLYAGLPASFHICGTTRR